MATAVAGGWWPSRARCSHDKGRRARNTATASRPWLPTLANGRSLGSNEGSRWRYSLTIYQVPRLSSSLDEHIQEMRAVTPPESKHALDLDGLRVPDVTFWTVMEDGAVVGCGAVKILDASLSASVRKARPAGVVGGLVPGERGASLQAWAADIHNGEVGFADGRVGRTATPSPSAASSTRELSSPVSAVIRGVKPASPLLRFCIIHSRVIRK